MAKAATAKKVVQIPVGRTSVKGAKIAGDTGAVKKGDSVELVTVKSGALSTDVGPRVIATLSKAYDDESKAHALLEGVASKRYDIMAQLTEACMKAAKADDTIDLSVTFKGDNKLMGRLNDQLGLALGFRSTVTTGKGDKAKKRITYSAAVAKYFPQSTDNKDSAEYKRKSTLRSNFLHQLKKCAQAAAAMIDKGIVAKMDKEAGTLRISGPTVKKAFGADSVLLNEKKAQEGEGTDAIALTAKPSFTAIAAMGAEKHGATVVQKSGTTHRGTAIETNPDKAMETVCKTLVDMISRQATLTERMRTAMESVRSAIEKKFG